ncbi:MAG TPA: hypothetical protein ENI86_01345 [Acidimicrobiales bacterium]|nr:hypothetical protein [Acidimicrobiales bacterium]
MVGVVDVSEPVVTEVSVVLPATVVVEMVEEEARPDAVSPPDAHAVTRTIQARATKSRRCERNELSTLRDTSGQVRSDE